MRKEINLYLRKLATIVVIGLLVILVACLALGPLVLTVVTSNGWWLLVYLGVLLLGGPLTMDDTDTWF